jgi:hypothetical protein
MNNKIFLITLILLSACTAKRATDTASPPPQAPAQLAATPARITSLNAGYRFVVLDFSAGAMPAIGTRLNVYRDQELVGAVLITDPVRTRFATADIVKGELRVGDEAR